MSRSRGRFLSDIAYSTITWGVGMVALFVISPVLARTLGVYEYGLWSLARRVYTVAWPLAVMGLTSSIVRYVSMVRVTDPDRARTYAGIGSNLTAGSALIVVGILLAINRWVSVGILDDENLIPLLPIVAITIWLDAQVQTLQSILRSYGFIKDQSTFTLLAGVLNLVGGIALALVISAQARIALWGLVAASVVVFILQVLWGIRRGTPIVGCRWDWKAAKDLLVYGVPRIPAGFLLNMILAADTFFVGAMMSVTDAGYFDIASKLFGIAAGMMSPVANVAFPWFSELIGLQAERRIHLYLTYLLSFALYIGLFLSVIMAILAQPIVIALYTEEFSQAIAPLAVIMLGAVFYAFYIALRGYVAAYTVNPVLMYFLAIALLINVGLNAFLIPLYGSVGAAVGTVSAFAVLGSLTVVYTWRIHPLKWRELQVGRLPLALLPPAAVALFLHPFLDNLLFLVLGGALIGLIFIGMLWVLKVNWFVTIRDLVLGQLGRVSLLNKQE